MIVFLLMENVSIGFMVLAGQQNSRVTKEPIWLNEDMRMEAKHFKVLGKFLKDSNSVDSCSHSLSL